MNPLAAVAKDRKPLCYDEEQLILLLTMFSQFRAQYPQGSLTSELIQIDHGRYIVRALVVVDGVMLASGLAADLALETAEDQARLRALALLNLEMAPLPTELASPRPPAVTEPEPSPAPPTTPPLVTMSLAAPVAEAPAVVAPVIEALPPETLLLERPKENGAIPTVLSLDPPQVILPEPESPPAPSIAVSPPLDSLPPQTEAIQPQVEPLPLPSPAPLSETPAPLLTFLPETEAPPLDAAPVPALDEPIDFSEVIARSNVELKRLGWTSDQGRNYLLQTYGKRSRQLLSDEELLEFLQYLESQPTPS